MPRWTADELRAWEQRTAPAARADEDPESDIHDEVLRLCRAQGWYVLHSRMDRRTTNAVGAPDFVIFMPSSRVLCIEAKRGNAKLRPEQEAAQMHLQRLGHPVLIVRSVAEARDLLCGVDRSP